MKFVLCILLFGILTFNANADTINARDGLIGSKDTITVPLIYHNVKQARNFCKDVLSDTSYKCGNLITVVSIDDNRYAIFEIVH